MDFSLTHNHKAPHEAARRCAREQQGDQACEVERRGEPLSEPGVGSRLDQRR